MCLYIDVYILFLTRSKLCAWEFEAATPSNVTTVQDPTQTGNVSFSTMGRSAATSGNTNTDKSSDHKETETVSFTVILD